MKLSTMLAVAFGAMLAFAADAGSLSVSPYFQNHMVFQRGKPLTVWGKDAAGRTVTVSFGGRTANAVTGSDGFWEATFAQPFSLSSVSQTLTVSDNASESVSLSDILVGDVYLCSGQSNMHFMLRQDNSAVANFCSAADDGVRAIHVPENSSGSPAYDLPQTTSSDSYGVGWGSCAEEGHRRNITSVGLNFACYLRAANPGVPIGIVQAAFRGTPIEGWRVEGSYWKAMIAPYAKAKFCGVLWYQGESNAGMTADAYASALHALVGEWRSVWGNDLPFYAVQIATPGYYDETSKFDLYPAPTTTNHLSNYVRIRETQRLWDVSDTGTHGLVTIVDCAKCLGSGDLHPTDKNFVGRRLSLLARRDIYGETSLQAEGPVYTRAVREANGDVRIYFKSGTAKGLTAGRMKPGSDIEVSRWAKKSADPIRGFALCGGNDVWQDAEATVEGETIVLRAEGVASPTKFHYGYWCITRSTELEDGQRLNLYNESGLPMSPVAPQTIEDPNSSAKVADPVLTPASCYFSLSTNVTISCATANATIRYTVDGSEPTATSTVYSAPIALSATTTVKARAFASNKEASDIVFATYTHGEAPAPDPNPQWTNGAYVPSEWSPLGINLLASATASHTGTLSGYAGRDLGKLTDGKVAVDFASSEVVGFGEDVAAIWTFDAPKSIGTIRISSRWSDTSFDAIMVKDVYVLQGADWVALGTPNSHRTGLASITTGALVATLADDDLGYLAQNVSGLKIVFGKPETGFIANYYAEIEAIAPGGEVQPAETVATPSFTPASCTFYPTANVTLSCATSGATVRYTLDGSAPTESSAAYNGPIAISATTTVKARAFATGKNPSAVASATYTLVNPGTPGQTWTTCEFSPSTWSPLANNMLLGNAGTLTGTKSFLTSDITKITDGAIPSSNAQVSDTFGFAVNATVHWTFSGPKTLEKIRFTSCYIAGNGMYDDIKIAKIEVKTSGSDSWTDLGVEPLNYAGSGAANSALSATIEDDATGFLAQNVTALRITFGQQNNVAQYYAEIEAVGTASGVAPVETVASPTVSPASCTFYPTANVTLCCATAGATIRYTLDGSEPTASSAAYAGPIAISATTTVKARAFAADMNPSAVVSATYTYTEPVTPGPQDYPPVSTNATWTSSACAPASWTALGDNVLAGLTGSIVGQVATGYSTNDPDLLTDGAVPTAGGKDWIVGLTINSSISWTFAAPKTLDSVRVSCGYLAAPIYSGFTVSKVEVQTAGSAEWTTVSAAAGQMANNGQADILSLALADGSGAPLAVNASALKVTFAAPPIGFANYCAEIEAVERTEGGVIDPPEPPATYSIAIAAAENGTLETSVTNGIAAGTTVTVTATPNDGCSLVSVTVDGTAISGNTFTMPSANVTLAATFEEDELPPSPPPSGDKMFYIGETGYDSWAEAFAAAANGDTIAVGMDASFSISGGKTLTINLAGHSLEWLTGGWMYGSLTVVDTVGGGQLVLSGYSRNVGSATIDLTNLTGAQLTGSGIFWVNAATKLRFPSDMTLAACTSRIGNAQSGMEVVAEGVTYVYDGSSWTPQGRSYPAWIDTTDRTSVAKYDTWATKFGVSDASEAVEDAYLLNCANTPEAVSAAMASFQIMRIAHTTNDVLEITMPAAPEGGFNGKVTILGSETINGTYHAAEPTDRFFKAVLEK